MLCSSFSYLVQAVPVKCLTLELVLVGVFQVDLCGLDDRAGGRAAASFALLRNAGVRRVIRALVDPCTGISVVVDEVIADQDEPAARFFVTKTIRRRIDVS